jgi:hypothetical protein
MSPFDPTASGFVKLRSFEFPGGVAVYEYANDAIVDGNPEFLRINAYLSQDGDFVTVWRGAFGTLVRRIPPWFRRLTGRLRFP